VKFLWYKRAVHGTKDNWKILFKLMLECYNIFNILLEDNGGGRMNKMCLSFLIIFSLLAGCSKQESIQANGKGENWKGHIVYEITDSQLYDRGGIEYIGKGELIYVAFTLTTDGKESYKGELYPSKGQTAISFGTTVTNHPPTKDQAISSLNSSNIKIEWHTNSGEFEETINLRVN
jgi:hypothetical protein